MIRRFTLSMVLLLSMVAVQNVCADELPSVVTIYEATSDNIRSFTQTTNGSFNIWSYNETLDCLQASMQDDDQSKYSVCYFAFGINRGNANKYFDVKLTFDFAWISSLKYHSGLWPLVGPVGSDWMSSKNLFIPNWEFPNGGDGQFINSGEISLDDAMTTQEFNVGLMYQSSEDQKYLVKNMKIVGRRWNDVEDLKTVNSITEMRTQTIGTPVKLHLENAQITYFGQKFCIVKDATGCIAVPKSKFPEGMTRGDFITGDIYGYYKKEENFLELDMLTLDISLVDHSYGLSAIDVNDDDYWQNIGKFVTLNISEGSITVIDENEDERTRNFTGEYPAIGQMKLTGILFPTADGKKRIVKYGNFYMTVSDTEQTQITSLYNGFWCTINRQFEKYTWYSYTAPYEMTQRDYHGTYAILQSSEDGILNFTHVSTVEPGKPCLIYFGNNTGNLCGLVNLPENFSSITDAGEYKMVGTMTETIPNWDNCYYLKAGKTIKRLARGGKISAFRAYFEPNTPLAARTRSISIDGTVIATGDGSTTDIEEILNGKGSKTNGDVFNLNGQKVNINSYEKGIFIINGKKVIK